MISKKNVFIIDVWLKYGNIVYVYRVKNGKNHTATILPDRKYDNRTLAFIIKPKQK